MLPLSFVAVDTETTGLSSERDRIIEIGMVRVEDGEVVDRYSSLVDPGVALPAVITEITGISSDELRGAPRFDEIADEISARLEGAVFVAHNVEFDHRFLSSEFSRIGRTIPKDRLCTVELSRALYPDARGHSLGAIIERFGFTAKRRHRASDDAEVLVELLFHVESAFSEEALARALARAARG